MFINTINKAIAFSILSVVTTVAPSLYAADGGITLGTTRIIYPQDAKQVQVHVSNTATETGFLVQSWVEDAQGNKTKSLIATPPLFKSAPQNENVLRLMYVGEPLPTDRETLFYFNAKAIPAVEKVEGEDMNALILATITRIKLFVRPNNLPQNVETAKDLLEFKKEAGGYSVYNPTPYHITLTNVTVGETKVEAGMVAPKESLSIKVPDSASGTLMYKTINDYGGVTTAQEAKIVN